MKFESANFGKMEISLSPHKPLFEEMRLECEEEAKSPRERKQWRRWFETVENVAGANPESSAKAFRALLQLKDALEKRKSVPLDTKIWLEEHKKSLEKQAESDGAKTVDKEPKKKASLKQAIALIGALYVSFPLGETSAAWSPETGGRLLSENWETWQIPKVGEKVRSLHGIRAGQESNLFRTETKEPEEEGNKTQLSLVRMDWKKDLPRADYKGKSEEEKARMALELSEKFKGSNVKLAVFEFNVRSGEEMATKESYDKKEARGEGLVFCVGEKGNDAHLTISDVYLYEDLDERLEKEIKFLSWKESTAFNEVMGEVDEKFPEGRYSPQQREQQKYVRAVELLVKKIDRVRVSEDGRTVRIIDRGEYKFEVPGGVVLEDAGDGFKVRVTDRKGVNRGVAELKMLPPIGNLRQAMLESADGEDLNYDIGVFRMVKK